jgi:hypothetical protein
MLRQSNSESSSSIASSAPVASETGEPPVALSKSLHETWLDHLILLLHAAAGVEHELMVQYLYAAYSLGGDQVPIDQRDLVQLWRRNLLAIAKEEMGHFLTVQNILTLLGAPTLWARGNYPWDNQYFPLRRFEFSPLTMGSLSCYVYAEAPAKTAAVANRYYGIKPEEVNRIIEKVRKEILHGSPHRVEQLYAKIVSIITNPTLIPDSAFHPETFAAQASWEEWGKGYKPFTLDPETRDPDANGPWFRPAGPSAFPFPPTAAQARVIVSQVASRTEVLAALKLIGEQGEAADFHADDDQPSHFDRFIGIYEKFEKITWKPTRNVPNNPTTWTSKPDSTYIESEHSRNWAHLFNLRYRMLLTYLSHMYRLSPATDSTHSQMRPGTLHRVFSEMYNLRAIASILVRLPLMDEKQMPNDPRRAGPPFELPYTLALPAADDDCWRLHRELLVNSEILCQRLLPESPVDGRQYISALRDLDRQSIGWIDAVLQSPGSMRSSRS